MVNDGKLAIPCSKLPAKNFRKNNGQKIIDGERQCDG